MTPGVVSRVEQEFDDWFDTLTDEEIRFVIYFADSSGSASD